MEAIWPAFILHSRPLEENKQLLSLLMPEHGRCNAVFRRRQGKQQRTAQPFQQYLVSLGGRSELKTILSLEELGPAVLLTGRNLYSGIYLNELICRIWPTEHAADVLFSHYQDALLKLNEARDESLLQIALREFEYALLSELGVMPDLTADVDGQPLAPSLVYQFYPEQGLVRATSGWEGKCFIAISYHEWQTPGVLALAKHINRQLLKPLLGDKPLTSRALFQPVVKSPVQNGGEDV